MKLLAFDTSSEILVGALMDAQGRVVLKESRSDGRHSEGLLPFLEELLQEGRVPADRLACVTVGAGPGSFTGLRIGIAAAKMLGYAAKIRLSSVSSLEIIARKNQLEGYATGVLLDARRGQVYAALYSGSGASLKTLVKPALFSCEAFLKKIRSRAYLVGSGAVLFADALEREGKGRLIVGRDPEAGLPSAQALLEAATAVCKARRFVLPERLEPDYLRPKDCNVTLKK